MPITKNVKEGLPMIIIEDAATSRINTTTMDEYKDNVSIRDPQLAMSPQEDITTPRKSSKSYKLSSPVSVPRTCPSRHSSCDRFIPRRRSSHYDYASFKLLPPSSPSDWNDDVFNNSNTSPVLYEHYRRRMACLSEGGSEAKVLNFGSQGNLAVTKGISRSQESFDPNMTFVKTARKLPKEPDQVLDLPGIENNYFSNAVTWGAKGHIIAALGSSLYVTQKEQFESAHQLQTKLLNQVYTSVACSSDGRFLAAGTESGTLEIFDIEEEKCISSFQEHHSHEALFEPYCRIGCISWKPDSQIFATGCRSGLLSHWDMRTSEVVISNTFHKNAVVCGLSFSPSGHLLASSDSAHWLKVWDQTGQHACFSKEAHTASCRSLAWNTWKTGYLASGGGVGDGYIRVWNVFSGEMVTETCTNAQICSLVWSSITHELIASYSKPDKHIVAVYSYPDLKNVGNLPGHLGRVLHMGMGPCKTMLFTASADEMLKFWKIVDTKPSTPARSGSCSFLSSLR